MKKIAAATLAALSMSFAWAADADLIVIGSGGAGLSAAITAAQAGKSVIVLEKMAYLGGNTNRSEGGMNAAGTKQQLAHGVTDDSPMRMSLDAQKGGHWLNDPALTLVLAENARHAEEWLLSLGADFCHRMGRGGGQTAARRHGPCDGSPVGVEVMRVLTKAVKDLPKIEIRKQTRATELLMKDGAVVGVKAVGKDGKAYSLEGSAVVLATGGFGNNQKLIEKLRPEYKGFKTTNHPGAMGEGIDLALGAGATLVDMREIQAHPTAVPGKGILISESMRASGSYLVNNEGRRFTNELNPRDVVANAILQQPGKTAWILIDNALVQKNKLAKGYTSADYAVHGNTVEELAAAMKVSPAVLKETMDKYVKAYNEKKDPEFGRPEMITPCNVFPMSAIPVAPAIHHTMGGVRINTHAQVIGTNAKPIPGLYAAGEVTGGVHGGNRIGGNAVADIITFGRIAGQTAADNMK